MSIHESFETQKNKIEKTWNRTKDSKDDIEQNKNTFNDIKINQHNKAPNVLFDTGWQSKTVDFQNFSNKQSEFVYVNFNFSVDPLPTIEIEPTLLPFIKAIVFVKPPPNGLLTTYVQYDFVEPEFNNVVITGDGTKLYEGNGIGLSKEFSFIPKGSLKNIGIPNSHFKDTFSITFNVERDANGDPNPSTISGQIVRINVRSSPNDFDSRPGSNPGHKIIAVTENDITAIGDENGGLNTNVTRTISWSETGSVTINGKIVPPIGQVIGTNINLQPSNQPFSGINTTTATPGDWLFYSSQLKKPVIINIGSAISYIRNGVTFSQSTFTLLPSLSQEHLATDQYSDIHLSLNTPNVNATFIDKFKVFNHKRDNFNSNPEIVNPTIVDKNISFIKTNTEKIKNNSNIYKIFTDIKGSFLLPTGNGGNLQNVGTKNDGYSFNGSTWTISSSVEGLKTSGLFATDFPDFEYRIVYVIKNPHLYHDIREYNGNQ